MHLVHKSADGMLAVVGIMIETGAENAAIKVISDRYDDLVLAGPTVASSATLNATALLPTGQQISHHAALYRGCQVERDGRSDPYVERTARRNEASSRGQQPPPPAAQRTPVAGRLHTRQKARQLTLTGDSDFPPYLS